MELLANEEDTVTVGQDLFRIEAGEGGGRFHLTFMGRNISLRLF